MALLDLLTRPPRLPRAVDRPRLHRLLLGGIEPGQLVVAPPGSGKTVAAAQLLDAARALATSDGTGAGHSTSDSTSGTGDTGDGEPRWRTGWCRLTPGASGGADLVRLIGAALGTTVDDPGAGPLERAATVLELLGDEPVVLVVDDYELARAEECDAVLAEVLGLVPPDCRLVVCSALRPAGLVGRASVGQLAVVGPAELAFTEDEVAQLLALLGHDPAAAPAVHRDSAGWATAVAVLAEGAGREGRDLSTALEAVLDRAGATADPSVAEVLGALAVVPALSRAEVEAAGLDGEVLGSMAAATALLRPVGDGWALLDVMREPVRRRLGPERLALAAARIAPVLAERDPLAAAGMLLDAGDDGAAADVLAGHASGVAADAVVPLLYRMRPEVRRRLPPVLSGARATVEMDTALAGAEQRVQATADRRGKAEAQIAVGTILLHRGQLASAGAALEAALRLLAPAPVPAPMSTPVPTDQVGRLAGGAADRPGDVAVVAVATGWLGLARLWAGDLDGAAAAVAPLAHAEPTHGVWSLARWAAAELALARAGGAGAATEQERERERELDRVGVLVGELRAGGWPVAADAMAARLALAHGAEAAAANQAAAAYRGAAAAGGLDLLVAGPVHAWCLARAGRWDEAAAVADELRRRLGAVDTCARLQADLIAEAAARITDDPVELARRSRDIAAARRLGFAPVEAVARRWLPAAPAGGGEGGADAAATTTATAIHQDHGLLVQLLGPVIVTVDGRRIDDRAWRSRKAREVLVVLALAGEAGRRRDEVIEAVWPERDPAKGRSLLRTALADVRRILEPARPPGEQSRFLVSHGDRLTLAARTDLSSAERERQQAAAGEPGALAAAWALFRGELVADDPYADSLADARRSAEQLRVELAEALVAAGTGDPAGGSTETLVDAAAFLREREPWRTDLAGPVAAACRAAGDELAATRAERLLGPSQPPD
jgi:DNA-binding SARP family transcriptional activator